MTYKEREKIFSKEYLTISDVQALLGLTYQCAAKMIRQIKFKCDRLGIQGKLHVEDYFEYFNIADRQRYIKQEVKDNAIRRDSQGERDRAKRTC